jgi:hypothetical protein
LQRAYWPAAKEDERQDEEALRAAVMSLVYRAGEGVA